MRAFIKVSVTCIDILLRQRRYLYTSVTKVIRAYVHEAIGHVKITLRGILHGAYKAIINTYFF